MFARIRDALGRFTQQDADGVLPPFSLVLAGILEAKNSEKTFAQERFRVALYPALDETCDGCGRAPRWATLQFLDGDDEWRHLLTVHEAKLAVMKIVVDDVFAYLAELSEEALASKH